MGCLPTLRPIFDGRSRGQNKSHPYTDDSSRPIRSGDKMQILKSDDYEVHWSQRSDDTNSSATETKESA